MLSVGIIVEGMSAINEEDQASHDLVESESSISTTDGSGGRGVFRKTSEI